MHLFARRRRRVLASLVLPVVAVAVAGCGGGSGSSASQEPSSSPRPTPACPSIAPTPAATGASLTKALQSVPFDLPMPDHISVVGVSTTSDGIHILRFTTPTSLRDSVLFVVERYPKAGYVIGRGDAEATEADAPFVRGQVHGLARVTALQPCQTLWLLATVAVTGSGATSPLLVPHPTSSVTSALPFG